LTFLYAIFIIEYILIIGGEFMLLRVDVDEKEQAKCKIINFETASIIKKYYQSEYKAIRFIFQHFFKIDLLSIELINQDIFYNAIISSLFIVKTIIGEFKISIDNNIIIISNDEGIYKFKLESFSSGDQLNLNEMVVFQNDKIVIERFDTHKIVFEIHFKSNGKVLYMEIPIDRDITFNIECFNILKDSSNINDLKKFYLDMFYMYQVNYDRNNHLTILSVWQKSYTCDDFSVKEVKLDELSLQNGYIQDYQLGKLYLMNDSYVIIMLNNGVYTIRGFDNQKDCSLDFNKEMAELLERKKKLYF